MAKNNFTPELDYASFFALDLKKLPSEVLKIIKLRADGELYRRKCIDSSDTSVVQAAFVGLPISFQGGQEIAAEHLRKLLSQDWSHLFSGKDETRKYYVYAHVKPTKTIFNVSVNGLSLKFHGHPFYIGKGTGDRAYDLKRNQGHGALLKEIISDGYKESRIVKLIKTDLTESEALELESKLIYFFGTKYEHDRVGLLVNLDIPARPELMPWKTWVKMNKEDNKKVG